MEILNVEKEATTQQKIISQEDIEYFLKVIGLPNAVKDLERILETYKVNYANKFTERANARIERLSILIDDYRKSLSFLNSEYQGYNKKYEELQQSIRNLEDELRNVKTDLASDQTKELIDNFNRRLATLAEGYIESIIEEMIKNVPEITSNYNINYPNNAISVNILRSAMIKLLDSAHVPPSEPLQRNTQIGDYSVPPLSRVLYSLLPVNSEGGIRQRRKGVYNEESATDFRSH